MRAFKRLERFRTGRSFKDTTCRAPSGTRARPEQRSVWVCPKAFLIVVVLSISMQFIHICYTTNTGVFVVVQIQVQLERVHER